jgi:hypothetical protein
MQKRVSPCISASRPVRANSAVPFRPAVGAIYLRGLDEKPGGKIDNESAGSAWVLPFAKYKGAHNLLQSAKVHTTWPDAWRWHRVQAICDYVHAHIEFGYHHARGDRTASEGHAEQRGVCRDFAHLAVTLCRCMNIPARYCTGLSRRHRRPARSGDDGFFRLVRGSSGWVLVHLRRPSQPSSRRSDRHRTGPRCGRCGDFHRIRLHATSAIHRHHRGGGGRRAVIIRYGGSLGTAPCSTIILDTGCGKRIRWGERLAFWNEPDG